MTGMVDIFKADSEVEDKAFDFSGKLDLRDTEVVLVAGAVTDSFAGVDIAQTITGLTVPTAKYAWGIQKGTVFEGGDTFSAGVDIETGRLVYVMEISGTELLGIFD